MSFELLCQDSLKWLKKQPDHSIPNVVTGICDLNEMGKETTLKTYLTFFTSISNLIFRKTRPDGYCIFIQTDRKYDGQLIDKSHLLTTLAEKQGLKLLWHKIICQRDVGKTDLFRPTYSHFLCYSQTGKPGAAFPDVLPVGKKLYDNATPSNGAEKAIDFIASQIKHQRHSQGDLQYDIIDPFVGQGTIGIATLSKGLTFLGIDIDTNQCEITRQKLNSFRFL